MIAATVNVYLFAMALFYMNENHWFSFVALTLVFLASIILLGPIGIKEYIETKKHDE